MDFAADKKDEKEAARKMMKMVGSINEQIRQMGLDDPVQVRCVTCHHGVKIPQTLSAVMMKATNEKGADAAVESYRKLRDR
jgi:citrate lyase alpha subunit